MIKENIKELLQLYIDKYYFDAKKQLKTIQENQSNKKQYSQIYQQNQKNENAGILDDINNKEEHFLPQIASFETHCEPEQDEIQRRKDAYEINQALKELYTKPKFSEVLIKFIDEKHMTDAECYKKAGVDRRLFSKIRSDKDYTPSKKTVFAFILALKLNRADAQKLMESAGYSISYSYLRDVIISFCIENSIYNIYDVNSLLLEKGLEPILFE